MPLAFFGSVYKSNARKNEIYKEVLNDNNPAYVEILKNREEYLKKTYDVCEISEKEFKKESEIYIL